MIIYNTRLGEFCATHANWEQILTEEPYSLKIKKEDGFVIFNYNQLASDFNNDLVREARGIIFRDGEWECPVCHAFDKFGNYGESYVPDMDWKSVKVSEKIDGSIMKLWWYDGIWHLSTNANINAENAEIGDVRRDNFDQIFWEAVIPYLIRHYGPAPAFTDWYKQLDHEYTYIFELVSPYTRVVIPYEETAVYFLGARNNVSNYQWGCDERSATTLHCEMFPRPKLYPMQTLEQVQEAAIALPWSKEGYVCYDKNFNRCKIKSPRYVCAHFARNNNVITRKHLIDIILKGEMNEFLIYAADYADQMKWTKQIMNEFTEVMDTAGMLARNLRKLTRPEAAEVIKHFHKLVQPIMFANHARHVSGREYVRDWDVYKWERNIENFLKMTNGGQK